MLRRKDFKLGMGLSAFCVFLLAYLIPAQVGALNEAAALMPVVITAFILLLSILLMIQAARRHSEASAERGHEKQEYQASRLMLAAVIVIMAAYAWLLEITGFVLTSAVAMVVLFLVFGVRSLPRIVVISAVTLGALYLCFEMLLGAPLPMGTLIENLLE